MKALIIDKVHNLLTDKLNACNIEVDYLPEITRQGILNIIADYEILIIRSKTLIDKKIINRAGKLQIIGRYGAGTEGINKKYCSEKGIKIINSPEGNRNAVAEHAIGLLLSVINKICKANNEIKNGSWNRNDNWGDFELEGKTVGIIGYGNTGSYFAKKLAGFDVEVIAYDKYKSGFAHDYIKEVTLNDIFNYADVISLHIPLTPETKYFADDRFFNSLKKSPVFINTSRGGVTDTKALLNALKNNLISGAGLDVLEYEKSDFENIFSDDSTLQKLTKLDNVIITPHVAGWTNESYRKLAFHLGEKICKFLKNKNATL